MLTFRIKALGCKPIEGIYPNTQAAMNAAFDLYPEARSITVGPLR